jgi:hypothetical protein
MGTSRRKFLQHGSLSAIAAGFSLGFGDKILGREASLSSDQPLGLNRAAFASQLNTVFVINDGARKVSLKLVDVTDLGSKQTSKGMREAFSLVFRGGHSTALKQETYTFEHHKLGAFSFLMVPILSRDQSARYYEVNVNRLHG